MLSLSRAWRMHVLMRAFEVLQQMIYLLVTPVVYQLVPL